MSPGAPRPVSRQVASPRTSERRFSSLGDVLGLPVVAVYGVGQFGHQRLPTGGDCSCGLVRLSAWAKSSVRRSGCR
jgi:hypothetical protein